MLVLGIETSCDETAVAVVEDGVRVLSNTLATSRALFEELAGVIPEEAARQQLLCMIPVLKQALREANATMKDIDVIAVTRGPGLLGSLLVGTSTARMLAETFGKPIVGVHHTLGHLSSTWLDTKTPPLFPVLTLSASGGHTDLWYRTSHTKGELIGRTRDDAAGEAFDKGASLLGLPYPGGPSVAKAAEGGNTNAYEFPSPLKQDDTLDFSFSGLKTSLKYLLRDLEGSFDMKDMAASFQDAICEHLLSRLRKAADHYAKAASIHLVGGVSANKRLRELAKDALTDREVLVPSSLGYCTDNAAMIAAAGYFLLQEHPTLAEETFTTNASLPLEATIG